VHRQELSLKLIRSGTMALSDDIAHLMSKVQHLSGNRANHISPIAKPACNYSVVVVEALVPEREKGALEPVAKSSKVTSPE